MGIIMMPQRQFKLYIFLSWIVLLVDPTDSLLPKQHALKLTKADFEEIGNKLQMFETADYGFSEEIQMHLEKMDWVDDVVDGVRCVTDIVKVMQDYRQGEEYAARVFNSWGSMPPGVYEGNVFWWGAQDQCQSTRADLYNTSILGSDYFQGKHCLGLIDVGVPGFNPSIGLCIPETCKTGALEPVWDTMIKTQSGESPVEVAGMWCQKPIELDGGDITFIVVTSILVVLGILGVLVEVFYIYSKDEPNPGMLAKIVLSFSFMKNGRKILDSTQKGSTLTALNGMRVLTITWVVAGHTWSMLIFSSDNLIKAGDYTSRFSFQFMNEAMYSVDTFFVLSGFLVTYLTLKELNRNRGKINWLMFYVHRVWRLTPGYAFVIMFNSTLFRRTMRGPQGPANEYEFDYVCKDTWWTNLLYINNFYPGTNMDCAAWGWYLANDMQFYFISPLIIYPLYRKWQLGVGIMSALLLMNFIVTGVVSKVYDLQPLMGGVQGDDVVYWHVYVRPYYRIAPYLVGIFFAWFYLRNDGKFKFNKIIVLLGWLVTASLGFSLLYGWYFEYYSKGIAQIENQDVAALFMAVRRLAWGICVGLATFLCITGYGGPINSFLSWRGWVPLVKLSYMCYQVHLLVIFMWIGNVKRLFHIGDDLLITSWISMVGASFAAAFAFSLICEAPFMELEKVLLKPLMGNRDKPSKTEPDSENVIGHTKNSDLYNMHSLSVMSTNNSMPAPVSNGGVDNKALSLSLSNGGVDNKALSPESHHLTKM